MIFLIIIQIIAVVRGKQPEATNGGTATPAKKTRISWVGIRNWGISVLILGILGSFLWYPTREGFWMKSLPQAVQTNVTGRVILPFVLATLTPGQRVPGCLPRGTWKYEGVKGEAPYYRFKKTGSKGLGIGFFEKGGMGALKMKLPLMEDNRHGALLVSTDTLTNVPSGHDVIVSGECSPITVTPNVEGNGKGLTLPYPQSISLVFAHTP